MSEENQNPSEVSENIRRAAHDDERGGRARPPRDRGDREDREDRDDRGGKRFSGGFGRKKVCRFCTDSEFVMDYKNVRMLQSFTSEHGKIVPRRISGNCAFHQRALTTALKRARQIALVGYVSGGW